MVSPFSATGLVLARQVLDERTDPLAEGHDDASLVIGLDLGEHGSRHTVTGLIKQVTEHSSRPVGSGCRGDHRGGQIMSDTEVTAEERKRRKTREGLVVSTSMQKTVVVAVTERVRHARYFKTVQQTKKLYAHDEENDARLGDRVRVMETRPLSKKKRWRLVEIVERAR